MAESRKDFERRIKYLSRHPRAFIPADPNFFDKNGRKDKEKENKDADSGKKAMIDKSRE